MEQLPGDTYMIILYSSFLMDVKGGYQSGLTELHVSEQARPPPITVGPAFFLNPYSPSLFGPQAARKGDKSFLDKYALFSRDQMNSQKSVKDINGADLHTFLEQQRSYKRAIKVSAASCPSRLLCPSSVISARSCSCRRSTRRPSSTPTPFGHACSSRE